MIIRAPSFSPSPLQSDDGDRIPANLLQFSNGEQKNDQAGLAVTSQERFVRAPEFRIGASCYRALNAPAWSEEPRHRRSRGWPRARPRCSASGSTASASPTSNQPPGSTSAATWPPLSSGVMLRLSHMLRPVASYEATAVYRPCRQFCCDVAARSSRAAA